MEVREHIECQERNMEIPAVMTISVNNNVTLTASQGNGAHNSYGLLT